MFSKEQVVALREAGLSHVCLFNGEWVSSDGLKPLSEDELARVQAIIAGVGDRVATPQKKPVTPKVEPAPVQSFFKRGRGRPKKK